MSSELTKKDLEVLSFLWSVQQPAVIAEGFPFYEDSEYDGVSIVKEKWYESRHSGLEIGVSVRKRAGLVYPTLAKLERKRMIAGAVVLTEPEDQERLIQALYDHRNFYKMKPDNLASLIGLPQGALDNLQRRTYYFLTEYGRSHVPIREEEKTHSFFGIPIPQQS